MKKTYKLQGLDCPNCAQKVEQAVCMVDGVRSACVNFLTQRMTVEAAPDVFENAKRAALDAEPDLEIED